MREGGSEGGRERFFIFILINGREREREREREKEREGEREGERE